MAAENLNPLEELKRLDKQVINVTDLAGLKPIFYRLDEIARLHADDFEVQLIVGDVKQHLVNHGTRLKEQQASMESPPTVQMPRPPDYPPGMPTGAFQAPPLPNTGAFAPGPYSAPPQGPPSGSFQPQAPPYIPPGQYAGPSSGSTPPPPMPPPMGSTGMMSVPTAPSMPTGGYAAPPQPTGAYAYPPQGMPPQGPPGMPPPNLPPGGPPPSGSVNWKKPLLFGGLLGAILSIALIVVLVNMARKRNAKNVPPPSTAVQVEILTTPPGAQVRISNGQPNGDTKCTSNCKVPLDPGNYQVTAFLDGYEPLASSVTVATGAPSSLNLTFEAQPQSLRILTDLESGSATLDDQPPADLQEGQFILDHVAPGAHTVKIAGKNGDATFSFSIANAQIPAITGPVTTHNLIAVAVASFGTQAHMVASSGSMKLVVNGQPQPDLSPAGADVQNFQAGADNIVVGEGNEAHNMQDDFGPAPMLTVFLKSDLNVGTLIVSTGEDDVRVFLNDKEYKRKTQRGQLRIQTAPASLNVRVAKDGYEADPPQVAEVKKGAEVRLEFKLKPKTQVGVLQIRGAAPGVMVMLDNQNLGAVGPVGNFTYTGVAPGDHTIELRRDQFTPKRVQRSFKAGDTVVLTGADVVLASNANGTVKVTHNPAEATVTWRHTDESSPHDLRGAQVDLPPGSYVFTGKAPGFAEKSQNVQVSAGETRSIEIALVREHTAAPPPPTVSTEGMNDWEDPTLWKKEDNLWVHRGGGFIPYKLTAKGVFTFTVELIHGGNAFRGGHIRWYVDYQDPRNYVLFDLDNKNLSSKDVVNGKSTDRGKTQHQLEKQKAFTIQVDVQPDRIVHKFMSGGEWVTVDTFADPGRNFSKGKFGFLVQGNDEIGISDFKFQPR